MEAAAAAAAAAPAAARQTDDSKAPRMWHFRLFFNLRSNVERTSSGSLRVKARCASQLVAFKTAEINWTPDLLDAQLESIAGEAFVDGKSQPEYWSTRELTYTFCAGEVDPLSTAAMEDRTHKCMYRVIYTREAPGGGMRSGVINVEALYPTEPATSAFQQRFEAAAFGTDAGPEYYTITSITPLPKQP